MTDRIADNTALFRRALETLCAGFGRELSKPMMDAYYGTLGAILSDDEWRAGVRHALSDEERMPPPAWFLRDRRAAAERRVVTEAMSIFEKIADGSCTVTGINGRYVSEGSVKRRLGQVAAAAFTLAGGEAAFLNARPQDLPFVQQRFVAAFKGLATLALPPWETVKGALGDGTGG